MGLRTAFVAGLLLVFAGPAWADPAMITHPDWLTKPNGESMAEHYPPLATELELSGYAVIRCTVNAQGVLVDCRIESELPAGLGFGRAALALADEFRMKPATLNGAPVSGGVVNIPIRFQTPAPDPPTPLPPPVSAEAAKQALRVVDASKAVDGTIDSYEAIAKRVEAMGDDRDVARRAADALRRASLAHREDLRTAYARAFASVFSEAEMAATADYQLAAGDQKQGNDVYATVQAKIQQAYQRDVATLAHQAFCAKQACGSPADIQRIWRPADPRETGRIDNPQWAVQPDPSDIAGAQPRLVGVLGVNGAVRLTCRVADKGGLADCGVDEEAPAGLGYGAAALTLASGYQLSPIQLAGAAGRRVTVRVGFPAAELPEAFHVKPGPTRSLALAHQVTDADEVMHASQLSTEMEAANLAGHPPKGSNPKAYEAGVEAYRTGAQQALANFIEQSIDNVSTAYTEPQLEMRAAFKATPAGKAGAARASELGIALADAQSAVSETITADARAAFCKTQDCSATPGAVQSTAARSEPSTLKP